MTVLNRRLVLESPQRVPDGAGGFVTSWVAQGVVWAAIRPGAGRAVAVAGGAVSAQALSITLRAAPPGAPSRPRPDQRLRDGARVYAIITVADSADGRWLICTATEEVGQ